MKNNTIIHLVADYGVGDPAFTEVIQKLLLLKRDSIILPTSVPKFSTVATGFWIAQFATVNPSPDMVIFGNTAPRKDNKQNRDQNEGEGFLYAKLKNGVRVAAVNSGYSFSFIKNEILSIHTVNVQNKGSQFRSRDFYPEAVISIIINDEQIIGNVVPLHQIPDPPKNSIAWIDGYGNLKTTSRKSEYNFSVGQPVTVTIHGMKRTAFYSDGSFSVREGELAFAPGSSGGLQDPFMEIFLRGLSAYHEFGKPDIASEFQVDVCS